MGPLIGFVSAPRTGEFSRPPGAFFSAVVEANVGPNSWKIRVSGQSLVVTTDLVLKPGQTLRLRPDGLLPHRWIVEVAGELPVPGPSRIVSGEPGLLAAFVSQGLPLANEKLGEWSRWLARLPGPSNQEQWAASLSSRGQGPYDPSTLDLEPWLLWQKALEEGRSEPPPANDEFWDWWNTRKATSANPWLTIPIRWTYEDREDSGLLQAHWNAVRQSFDEWNFTAAPANIGFRLEAHPAPKHLRLTWYFFRPEDRDLWSARSIHWENVLSTDDLKVTLEIKGAPEPHRTQGLRGIDVEA